MAGQDATLTVAQAKAQQERIMAHKDNHQGPKHTGSGCSNDLTHKAKHQG